MPLLLNSQFSGRGSMKHRHDGVRMEKKPASSSLKMGRTVTQGHGHSQWRRGAFLLVILTKDTGGIVEPDCRDANAPLLQTLADIEPRLFDERADKTCPSDSSGTVVPQSVHDHGAGERASTPFRSVMTPRTPGAPLLSRPE